MTKTINNSAFTLIELLVVISIIGILAGMVVASFTSSQKQARDTARKSDMAQYRTALESFANAHNGLYPYMGGSVPHMDSVCDTALVPSGYAAACPQDSKSPNRYYGYYTSDGSGSLGSPTSTKYLIFVWGGLESVIGNTWVVCSSGKTGLTTNSWSSVAAFCP